MHATQQSRISRTPLEPGLNAGTVLAAGALVLLPIAAIAALGVAPLGALLALAIALLVVIGRSPLPRVSPIVLTILVALLAWACLSVSWTAAPDRAPSTAIRLATTIIGGGLIVATAARLEEQQRMSVSWALLLGVSATVGLLLAVAIAIHAQLLLNGKVPLSALLRGADYTAPGLEMFNRTASVIALLVWPACVVASRQSLLASITLLVGGSVLLTLLNSSTPILALAAGAIAFATAYFAPRATTLIFATGIVLVTALTPALDRIEPTLSRVTDATDIVDGSFNHRLQIWSFAADRANERAWTGWGLESSRALGDSATTDVTVDAAGTQVVAELLPLHPHNAMLQVWLELGFPGAALVGALLIWLVFYLNRWVTNHASRAAAFATLASGLVVAELSYGIWQGWWQSALWLTAGITAAIVHTGSSRVDPS